MYIFLDIDGVLVKEDEVPIDDITLLEADYAKFDATCLQEFEDVIRQYPETKIVISSAWREQFSLEEIKSRFSSDVAEKIIGVTPLARIPQKFFRHLEILEYLKNNHLMEETWVAIDDFAEHFPKDTPMVVTNRYHGFDKSAAEKLVAMLTQARIEANKDNLQEGEMLVVSPDGKIKRIINQVPDTLLTHSKPIETVIALLRTQDRIYLLEKETLS